MDTAEGFESMKRISIVTLVLWLVWNVLWRRR